MRRIFLTILVLAAVAVSTSGCLVAILTGNAEVAESGELIISTAVAEATTGVCSQDPDTSTITCVYGSNGNEFVSLLALINEFGVVTALIDPLVLELPADATDIAGTYDDGGANAGDLLVYPGLAFVPVDDDETLVAGPGKQLVILQLPPGVPVEGVNYQFALNFRTPTPGGGAVPPEVKGVFTGRLEGFGKVFYPPLLPCTTDVASLPAITLPLSATLVPLDLPPSPAVCQDRQYTYFLFPEICDLDNDHDVDRNDINQILAMRNVAADAGDPRDIDGDGVITVTDARRCVVQCTRPRCAQ